MAKCLINNTGNKGANGVMIQILNFFVSKGYTPTQACAIAGNISVESDGYKPNAVENGGKGEGVGLCQWSFSRKTALKDFTKNMTGGWQNVSNQLAYLWHELNSNDSPYKDVGKHFENNKNKTIGYYTNYWCDNFEKPDSTKAHKERRLSEAKKAAAIYEQLNKGECVVDTSDGGSSSNQNFSCNAGDGETLASDISIVEDSTVQTTTSQPNGNSSTAGNAKNNTVDTKPLFVGDSWAYKIWHNDEYMKKNWGLLAKSGLSMSNLPKQLKRTLSNKNRRPKYIVIYCGDDTKLTKNTSSIFTTGTTELVKGWCRDILGCCNGIQVYFCTNVMDSLYKPSKSDYYLTAASVLNRALRKLKSEGDSAKFKLIEFDTEFRVDVLFKNSVEIPSDRRMTLNPTGFSKMGPYIRKQIHGGS